MHRWQCTGRIRLGQLVIPLYRDARLTRLTVSLPSVAGYSCRAFCCATQTRSASQIAGLSITYFVMLMRFVEKLFRITRYDHAGIVDTDNAMNRHGRKFADESSRRAAYWFRASLRDTLYVQYVTFIEITMQTLLCNVGVIYMARFISITLAVLIRYINFAHNWILTRAERCKISNYNYYFFT